MSTDLTPDLCILGGGAGGVSLALGAAACDLSVVLIEKASLGGRRLTHSVPRNALLAAIGKVTDLGVGAKETEIDFARIRDHIASVVAAIGPNYTQSRLEALNIRVIRAAGRFTGPDTCEARGLKIKARRFVVATGAVEKSPPIPGLDLVRPFDCAALCALSQPPRCFIIIGADPEGLVLAQAMRRIGSVVIVILESKLFSSEDEELAAPVRAAFARDGIVIHEGTRITRIEPRGEGVCVFVAAAGHEKPITGSHIWVAAGCAPVVEGLGLAEAKVRYDEQGIKTRAGFATSNRRIHALGTVVRGAQYDGAAEQHASVVLGAILGLPGVRIRTQPATRVILTCPPIAVTGLSETRARAEYRRIHVLRWPFAETERAQIEQRPAGHVKLLASRRGTLLGAGIVGPGAEELINLCALAISKGVTARDIASMMVSYPALGDAARRAAIMFPANRLGYSLTQQMLRFLRWLREGLP
ncbi:MAG TPA: NAD(P)/FAD-dependent oxidoreductase [Methylocella sp.]|nr:NAD(P)/FAD-dependent oxidoreductase [Methylocella sp.]